jgi:hypothetical protein
MTELAINECQRYSQSLQKQRQAREEEARQYLDVVMRQGRQLLTKVGLGFVPSWGSCSRRSAVRVGRHRVQPVLAAAVQWAHRVVRHTVYHMGKMGAGLSAGLVVAHFDFLDNRPKRLGYVGRPSGSPWPAAAGYC